LLIRLIDYVLYESIYKKKKLTNIENKKKILKKKKKKKKKESLYWIKILANTSEGEDHNFFFSDSSFKR